MSCCYGEVVEAWESIVMMQEETAMLDCWKKT
jgi:hypothetical protein